MKFLEVNVLEKHRQKHIIISIFETSKYLFEPFLNFKAWLKFKFNNNVAISTDLSKSSGD